MVSVWGNFRQPSKLCCCLWRLCGLIGKTENITTGGPAISINPFAGGVRKKGLMDFLQQFVFEGVPYLVVCKSKYLKPKNLWLSFFIYFCIFLLLCFCVLQISTRVRIAWVDAVLYLRVWDHVLEGIEYHKFIQF